MRMKTGGSPRVGLRTQPLRWTIWGALSYGNGGKDPKGKIPRYSNIREIAAQRVARSVNSDLVHLFDDAIEDCGASG